MTDIHPPEGILVLTAQCPHCAGVLKVLSEMVKQGELASLEIINLEKKPEIAKKMNIRSVPWIRIGWMVLEGEYSQKELQQKVRQASSKAGAIDYIAEELQEGRVSKIVSLLSDRHEMIGHVLALLDDPEAKINIRLGIGVILEDCATADWFAPYIPELTKYTRHKDERVRADACHYLSLTQRPEVITHIRSLLDDTSQSVREVAEESLEELSEAGLKI